MSLLFSNIWTVPGFLAFVPLSVLWFLPCIQVKRHGWSVFATCPAYSVASGVSQSLPLDICTGSPKLLHIIRSENAWKSSDDLHVIRAEPFPSPTSTLNSCLQVESRTVADFNADKKYLLRVSHHLSWITGQEKVLFLIQDSVASCIFINGSLYLQTSLCIQITSYIIAKNCLRQSLAKP